MAENKFGLNKFMNYKYNKDYFKKYSQGQGYLKQKNNPTAQKRLNELKVLTKTKGRLLDIGCGYGFFLDKAEKAMFKTYGIDMSSHALAKIQNNHHKYRLDVSQNKLPFKNNFFDVITLHHVLEHITNPSFLLGEIWRVLKRNGILFIEVPIRKRWIIDKSHVSYFNSISLTFILHNIGFTIIKIGEEGGKFRNLFGLIRLLLKGHTLFNFVPRKTGSFLICYAQKK